MKKISILLIAAILLSVLPARADEGMWLLPLLEKLNIKKMQELGLRLSAKDIYDINNASLKDAIVQFGGGCTGEIISDEGLLITNHHCGYGSIQALSTVEHDYLKDGFWAMNKSQELPVKGLSVTFVNSFMDVTDQVNNALKRAKTPEEEQAAYKKITEKLTSGATAGNKNLRAYVTSLYNDNIYYLITTKTYRDIRFVGAPPSSIGKFGADTDNWMWPRHTGDFSMFRVYADQNNDPAEYSPDNIPYRPKKSLAISLKGVKPNDYTMIIGFPGRTTRHMTSEEARQTQSITNAIAIYVRGIAQDILMKDMLADPKIRIQYASKYAGSSNGWKKYIGMNETFDKLNVIERRAEEEKTFTDWVNQSPERKAKYGNALDMINTSVIDMAEPKYVMTYLNESLNRIELLGITRNPKRATAFYKDYSMPTDKKVAKAMIELYRDNVKKEYQPSFYEEIDAQYGGDIGKFVDHLYETSVFSSPEKLAAATEQQIADDPAKKIAQSVIEVRDRITPALTKDSQKYKEGKKAYMAGIMEMRQGEAMYPDANSTMRLTYGQVLPYSPRDGVEYNYYTTLDGVMEKEDPDNWEFVVPDKLKDLYKKGDFGEYGLENGKMPVCFISNNDITGGNSGSPVLNDKGELLGLAFDGNWEAMSGDVIFEPELQRCIGVDIRYVLFIIDKFGGAGYLLDEMKIVR